MQECSGPWACFSQHMLERLWGVILLHHAMLIMVVRSTFEMHLGMRHLKRRIMVECTHIPGRCESLAKEGQTKKDCEQTAHGEYRSGTGRSS